MMLRELVVALSLLIGGVLGQSSEAINVKPPQVFVYTRQPIEYGTENQLICHCLNFHPPLLELDLKQDGKVLENCEKSDMIFQENWAYQVTKHRKFVPKKGVEYTCEVRHNDGHPKSHKLDPVMLTV